MDALKSIGEGQKQAEEPPIQLGDETAGSSLIDDSKTSESLRRIVARITRDEPALEDDAMQECRIRLWRLASTLAKPRVGICKVAVSISSIGWPPGEAWIPENGLTRTDESQLTLPTTNFLWIGMIQTES